MSFLQKGSLAPDVQGMAECAAAAYTAAACGDWTGAWLLLADIPAGSPPDVLYNKSLCLLKAGEAELALATLTPVFHSLDSACQQNKKRLDTAALRMLEQMGPGGPPPLNHFLTMAHPAYAALLARWLMVFCLAACGRGGEACKMAESLSGCRLSMPDGFKLISEMKEEALNGSIG